MPALAPALRALLRSQSGTQAGAWLALRRRLRLPLPLTQRRCGGDGQPVCGREADVLGDHRVSCPRSGLLARRALAVEEAWVRVAREAVGPRGPRRATAVALPDHCSWGLDLVVYGATERGEALCCDALVSPVRSDGRPHAGAADRDGVALSTAERRKRTRYPELGQPGPQRLVVLAAEVGGRWHATAAAFVRQLARVRARRAPPAVRRVARAGWSRRWWGMLGAARGLQHRPRPLDVAASACWRGGAVARGCPLPGPARPQQPPPPRVMVPVAAPPPLVRACRRGALLVVSLSRFTQPFHCSSHPRAPKKKKKMLPHMTDDPGRAAQKT